MLCVFFYLNSYSTESIDVKDMDSYTLDLIRKILCNEKKFRVYIRIGNGHDEVLLPVIKTSIDDMRRDVEQQLDGIIYLITSLLYHVVMAKLLLP